MARTDARPAPDPKAPSATAEIVFTSDDVLAATSKCTERHGDVDAYGSVDGLVARLSGTWLFCPMDSNDPLGRLRDGSEPVGVEFTEDGHFYWLVDDGSSGVKVTVWFPDRSTMGTHATFEAGPRRLVLQLMNSMFFVPLSHPGEVR